VIVLDANILVSAVLGKQVKRALRAAIERGVGFGVPKPQVIEAEAVLREEIGLTHDEAVEHLRVILRLIQLLDEEFYASAETAARERLHARGQSDWPVLAAALAAGGGVWSHDKDFFGVGAPVWSTRNLQFVS